MCGPQPQVTVDGMGYQTKWVGAINVTPPLNKTEIHVVNRLAQVLYDDERSPGPRELAMSDAAILAFRQGVPRGWSTWGACAAGCCLSYDGSDKANFMVAWLKYLMNPFLTPGAAAESVDGLGFLTCDHVLNGMVVGAHQDIGELYSITVRDNDQKVEVLWPGDRRWSTYQSSLNEQEIDGRRAWAPRQYLTTPIKEGDEWYAWQD